MPPHVSMGFNQTWIFLTDVLPRAIKKYGGADPEALRKAALDTDIPDGGTIQGYGVKFYPAGRRNVGAERALLAGGDAVHQRQDRSGLAGTPAHRRAGAAVAEEPQLLEPVVSPHC